MNIYISKTMVELGPSAKTFNGEPLERIINVDTNIIIVNEPYVLLPPSRTMSTQLQNTSSSIYTNKIKIMVCMNKYNDDIYQ